MSRARRGPLTRKQSEKWVRSKADELALEQGCLFDPARGEIVIEFATQHLKLYEGESAGEPLLPRDWQIEATQQIFGWVRWSDRWQRYVRRYRTANVWVPKKSKKSPTLAWWGLYLLIGDGEQGGKTFFCAKDGSQARDIAGKHSIEMLKSSPELDEECKINLSKFSITHLETASILLPLALGDVRSQKSKEGLNGNALVDEVHVVDRAAMGRLSRMGISRSEPLIIGVSTAGDDPTSYGFEQWEFGEQVNAGTIENLTHYHKSYHAPQDLSDADLAADPEKYIRMANPSLGHTIDLLEILSDYHQSCKSTHELSLFKMYRLNIWQGGTDPWLRVDLWNTATVPMEELFERLAGRECYAGLDLAKTTDTTALVLCFPPQAKDERIAIVPFFWLPKDAAAAMKDKVPYDQWAKQGFIELTPGAVTDYGYIRNKIAEIRERFDLRKLLYDPYNASQFAHDLEADGLTIEECQQTYTNLNEPTKEFERLIIANRIQHPGSKCMDWQVGNARTKTDSNGNFKICKPKRGDFRKVDGPAAAVMALAGAMEPINNSSFYDQEGAEIEVL
jgi:phage terminase large subunit-like protein